MNPNVNAALVVMAAGLGKRFKSSLPKVLHRANGLPMLHHVLRAASQVEAINRILVVVGNGKEQVMDSVLPSWPNVEFVDQPELLGTGDAVRRCKALLQSHDGPIVVLPGDAPVLLASTIRKLIETHLEMGPDVTVITAELDDPTGYGRIIENEDGSIDIVEERDATADQKKVKEISAGMWCFQAGPLFEALDEITPDNAQGEYYLPDAALAIAARGGKILTLMTEDPAEIEGANDRTQLASVSNHLRARKAAELAQSRVTIVDPANTYIEDGVEVGADTTLLPGTILQGATRIGERCTIGPYSQLSNTTVGDDTSVSFTHSEGAVIGNNCEVGPYVRLRPGAVLKDRSKAGTFIEVVRSTIGEESRVPHLSYVGDTTIGTDVNLGAGTIIGNYNGETEVKSNTTIEDGVDTGSGTTIVAPVTIGKDAMTGAGAVVTKDVESGDVVIGIPAKPIRKRKARPPHTG